MTDVKVEQVDREAAADIASTVRDNTFNSLYICEGRCDSHHIVQAIATAIRSQNDG